MNTPDPTWYDVLGVPRDASAAQIKAAWRNATDKFEPGSGSGQFRMFNDAADVLLDPTRRAAYDETLVGEPGPAPVVLGQSAPSAANATPVATEHADATDATEPRERAGAVRPTPRPDSRRLLVAAALVVLAVAALVLAGYFALQVRKDAAVADARSSAPATAERAAKAMLAYDYRQLPADRDRAAAFLTPAYKKKYLQTFSLLEKNKDGTPGAALQTKSVVTASVLGSGVVDVQSDVARVLVFVNQVAKKGDGEPQIFQNRVAMTMTKDGNRWLVSDLKSY